MEIPEIRRYFRKGRYLLAEVRGREEAVVLARLIGPRKRATVTRLNTLENKEEKEKTQKKEKEETIQNRPKQFVSQL